MEEARKFAVKSPSQSRATTPIQLPDTTGSDIIRVIRDRTPEKVQAPKYQLSPSPNLFKQAGDKSPLISISSPEKKQEEPDLINLESAKTSPVLPVKNILDDSSLESIDKIIDSKLSRSSDSNSLDDNRKDSIPTSPSSSDSLSKKGLLSPESFTTDEKIEDVESKNVTFSFDEVTDEDKSEVKISDKILKKVKDDEATCDRSEPKETEEDNLEKEEHTHFEEIAALKEEEFETTETAPEYGVSSEDNVEKEICVTEEERQNQDVTVAVSESVEEDGVSSGEEKIQIEQEVEEEAKFEKKDVTEKVEEVEQRPEYEKSPLTCRNIQRVGDRGRRQPKTGWL